jgi:hypothetical protein
MSGLDDFGVISNNIQGVKKGGVGWRARSKGRGQSREVIGIEVFI